MYVPAIIRRASCFRKWRRSGVQVMDMFKYRQVSDVVFMKSGPVDGVGLEIVKCYGDTAVPVPYSNTAVTGSKHE